MQSLIISLVNMDSRWWKQLCKLTTFTKCKYYECMSIIHPLQPELTFAAVSGTKVDALGVTIKHACTPTKHCITHHLQLRTGKFVLLHGAQ